MYKNWTNLLIGVFIILDIFFITGCSKSDVKRHRLFPTELSGGDWVRFRAEGFSEQVTGVIFRSKDKVACGMPLGGVDVGCIDLETSGLLGHATLFNSHVPRRAPINLPILGISAGDSTWVLCTKRPKKGSWMVSSEISEGWPGGRSEAIEPDNGNERTYTSAEPTFMDLTLEGVNTAREIHYWGHYPVADLEFETNAPVSVGLRAWTPFLPGDVVNSMIPGAVFEVRLQNTSASKQKGAIAFSFPGPTVKEAGMDNFARKEVRDGAFNGVLVCAGEMAYTLGVIDEACVRLGGELGADGGAWAGIAKTLPDATFSQPGSSAAVDFSLGPGAEKVVRFVLSWSSPTWKGGGHNWAAGTNYWGTDAGTSTYTHMYARHYPDALKTARLLAGEHEPLLKRILAWQEVLYTDKSVPGWLADCLINNFHLISEVGMWAQAKPPIGEWVRPEDGLWGLNECPKGCPQIECGGNSYYGGMAVLYTFPELTLSTLRGYKAYQYPDGCPAWIFGGVTGGTAPVDFVSPTRGFQIGQNGSKVVGMIARYWVRKNRDQEFLKEFYPMLRKLTEFTFNLNPLKPYGLISLPDFDLQESFEHVKFKGMTSHVGIIRLYHLKMVEEMARRMEDNEFADQCRRWYDTALELMEKHLWGNGYYIQHKDPESTEVSNVVMGYQLDGEFRAKHDGIVDGVLPNDRVKTTLETLKRVSMSNWGPRVWSDPAGGPVKDFKTGYWTPDGVHSPTALWMAATYMYHGDREYGVELARKIMFNMVVRQGWAWDMPIVYNGENGNGIWGNDYGQMMAVWSLPAALAGTDLAGPCQPGGLVERMIRAAQVSESVE